ncbi:MAG: sel1 repeat family protein [Proteobacteria bacterium]|nr:sel1 repeat family protein [Pseudomonadota bacterium]
MAKFWYEKAAEQGHLNAQFNLGLIYQEGEGFETPDYEKARYWYEKAAKQNDQLACFNLGWLYFKGLGLAAPDYEKATFWYEKSAEYFSPQINNL